MEYYSNNGVTFNTDSMSGTNTDKPIKSYNTSPNYWWLRSASSNYNSGFASVRNNTYGWTSLYATNTVGVAPAFRIG